LGDKDAFEIEFESHPNDTPQELAHLEKIRSESISEIPEPLQERKQTTNPKENMFRSVVYKNQHRHMRKWKH
jgi:hypothetical protein